MTDPQPVASRVPAACDTPLGETACSGERSVLQETATIRNGANLQQYLISRRGFLAVSAVAGLPTASVTAATTDLAVTCDTASAPAIARAAAAFTSRTGTRIRLHPTAPGLILPQLEREIQNDILVSTPGTLEQAERQGLIEPGGRTGTWRNRLVVAVAREPGGPDGSFAAPDPSPGSDIDGIAILQRLGLVGNPLIGAIDTGAVAWLLTNGAARQGLLHQTEVSADERFRVTAKVPDDAWPPILYAATVTKLARRGDPSGFVTFLKSDEAKPILLGAGLEAVL